MDLHYNSSRYDAILIFMIYNEPTIATTIEGREPDPVIAEIIKVLNP